MSVYRKTLGQQFDETAERFADHLFIVDRDRRITFGAARRTVDAFARGLLDLGVEPGDNVALWMTNYAEFPLVWLAVAKIGAALVPINTRYKADEAAYLLAQSESTALITMDRFVGIDYQTELEKVAPELGRARPGALRLARLPHLREVIVLGAPRWPAARTFDDVVRRGEALPAARLAAVAGAVSPDDRLIIVYTSGTTGRPKGAVHTHAIVRHEVAICRWRNLTHEDRFIAYLPFFHVGAGFTIIIPCVITGASMVLMEAFDPREALRTVERERVTQMDGIPTHFIMMLDHPDLPKFDVSSLRGGWVGGAPVPKEVVDGMIHRLGMRDLMKVYGMTETTSVTTFTRIGDPIELISTTDGVPIADYIELRIGDPATGREQPAGTAGEICVRGPIVMQGYYKQPEETARAIDAEGWFHTGDLGVRHANGYLTVTGRLKDMFIVGGTNAYPAEIEAFLHTHPKVKQAYVIGVPDHRLGEVGMAFVELKEGQQATEEEIVKFFQGRMANYKIPRHVRFATEFPMTPSGKIQKFRLREQALSQLQRGPGGPVPCGGAA
jgi:fatty-acyl-CoA synthase